MCFCYVIIQMTLFTSHTLPCLPSLTASHSSVSDPWKLICALLCEMPYWRDEWRGECDIPAGITKARSACCGIIPAPTCGLRQTCRYHRSRKTKNSSEVQKSKVEWSEKDWERLSLSSLLSVWRHTVMTSGPRAGSRGKGRGEEVKTVGQHNLINLCQTPLQVVWATE